METFPYKGISYPLKVRINKRAKRFVLRVCPKTREIRVTRPQRSSLKSALTFLEAHKGWVEKQLELLEPQISSHLPAQLTLFDIPYTIHIDPLRRNGYLCMESHTLFLPPKNPRIALRTLLKDTALKTLTAYCQDYAKHIGKRLSLITFKDPRTRWGSCTSQGNIMLSWRLVLAPRAVASYVCAHEVAHLLHMNHSKAFWECVATMDPLHKQHRKWLKENGKSLFQVV